MSVQVEARPPCPGLQKHPSQRYRPEGSAISRVGGFAASALGVLRQRNSQCKLGELPDYLLADIGLNRAEVAALLRRG